jgi:exodeoxyribonuclease-1
VKTFFFYDLETSGLNPRQDRIMQFAGQRTDMDLNPIGEPVNLLVRLSDDTLPSPYALLVTGITPQQTRTDGIKEVELAQAIYRELMTPDTITLGYNSIRFDDEFLRYHLWRNFFDPYEWAWSEGRSRWDLLDVVRMTRALRPEGIEWPVVDGKPTNSLEKLTVANGISHEAAHDALSDVNALIDVARLIRDKQPQLFDWLLKMRDKNEVKRLVNLDDKREFVYSSGRYDNEHDKTTVAFPLTAGRNGNVVVADLRYDPTDLINMNKAELKTAIFPTWEQRQADGFQKAHVKELQYNRCPAIAPLGVLEQNDGWAKIGLNLATIAENKKKLLVNPDFAERVREIFESRPEFPPGKDAESQLYDGFVGNKDKVRIEAVRNASEDQLADFNPDFADERLPDLLLHFKARNYPKTLSQEESERWESWREERITAQSAQFAEAMKQLAVTTDAGKLYILEELQLWFESVAAAEF